MNLYEKLPWEYLKYNIFSIKEEASKKKLYRLIGKKKSFVVIDFSINKKEYFKYLKIYEILKNINISIPRIIERIDKNFILVLEDFGDLRFDKVLSKNNTKKLLKYAVKSLLTIKKSINYNENNLLKKYDLRTFKKEITELPEYYFPYLGKKNTDLQGEFIYLLSQRFKEFNFNFNSFCHKDFNINNLIFLPLNKSHLKCGIIDFQDAFCGESFWDLFSLLEDSRILFTREYNNNLIEYFYANIDYEEPLSDFILKYNFLNLSRQSRLLGRWVKLSRDLNQDKYLKYIPITKKRISYAINTINSFKITRFYNKHILDNE